MPPDTHTSPQRSEEHPTTTVSSPVTTNPVDNSSVPSSPSSKSDVLLPAPAAAKSTPDKDACKQPPESPKLEEALSDEAVPSDADIIDMETFEQILELDEEDSREFSRGMTTAYYSQAVQTFKEMDEAQAIKDLPKLSSLGHFLKGSSAALGLRKVQASCEKIQHYGKMRDEEAGKDLTKEEAHTEIGLLLIQVKKEYAVAEKWLKDWYLKNAAAESDTGGS